MPLSGIDVTLPLYTAGRPAARAASYDGDLARERRHVRCAPCSPLRDGHSSHSMTSEVEHSFPRVDAVLAAFATALGRDRDAYRNHVHRVLNYFAALVPEVRSIILQHHKLTPYGGPFAATVEPFRRADLVDLSLGVVRSAVSPTQVRAVRAA